MGESQESIRPEPQNPKKPRRLIRATIRKLAPYAICGSLLILINNHWSSIVGQRETELRNVRQEAEKARSDLEQMTVEFDSYRKQNPEKVKSVGSSVADHAESERTSNQIQIRVASGSTATIWGDDLQISLLGTLPGTNQSKYKVNAKVASPGYSEMGIMNAASGYSVGYSGKDNFEIKILATDKFSAKFLITRH